MTDLTQFKLYPDTYKDFMSYCQPAWVSDYTYTRLYNAQMESSNRIANQPKIAKDGLFIRASTGENGIFRLEPVYAFKGSYSNLN